MKLQHITPEGIVLERRQVQHVTVPGAAGRFTVLHGHAPIVSVLQKGHVSFAVAGHEEEGFDIEFGIIHVKDDMIKIIGPCANL